MKKVLFIDRDGTLIYEPEDFQIDSFEKLKFLPGVISNLGKIARELEYELVMVTNQDGLGTEKFTEENFFPVHEFILQTFANEDVVFSEVFIDRSYAIENKPTRKPNIGFLEKYFSDRYDLENSFVIGDRETDLQLATNLGVTGLRYNPKTLGWTEIARQIADAPRRATIARQTKETKISVAVDLDAVAPVKFATGLGFFDHMLDQIARNAGISLVIECTGDLHIDEHHTVEDVGLALGAALKQALGDKRGIGRYGFTMPMDEAKAEVAIDLSGRPFFVFEGTFPRENVGQLPSELVPHFFQSLATTLGATLHMSVKGDNTHHMIEALFKGFGRALRPAVARGSGSEVPSTKGVL